MIPGTLLVVVALAVATLSSVAEAFKGRCGQQTTEEGNLICTLVRRQTCALCRVGNAAHSTHLRLFASLLDCFAAKNNM